MSFAEDAKQLALDARAAADRVRQEEAARCAAAAEAERRAIQRLRKEAVHAIAQRLGPYRIESLSVHSMGGHDGVGIESWPAEIRAVVGGLPISAFLPYHAAVTLTSDPSAAGESVADWYFEYGGKRFSNLEQLGEILLAEEAA